MLISKFDTTDIERKVLAFEKKHNIVLPEQYKAFLLKYNGGYTPKTKFKVGKIRSDIRAFYGIDCKKYDFYEIEIPDWIEKGLLPIAADSFGNYLVIGLVNSIKGKIFFSDHEQGYRLDKIGDNFKIFLKSCKSEIIDDEFTQPVHEREAELIARGRGHIITDSLRKAWQAEIDKYTGIVQEEVILE